MARINPELVTETAEAILNQIKAQADRYTHPEQVQQLAEAFATVAAATTHATSTDRKVVVR